jgi:hypothetical protein
MTRRRHHRRSTCIDAARADLEQPIYYPVSFGFYFNYFLYIAFFSPRRLTVFGNSLRISIRICVAEFSSSLEKSSEKDSKWGCIHTKDRVSVDVDGNSKNPPGNAIATTLFLCEYPVFRVPFRYG